MVNNPISAAISIEYPFQPNTTYEITINALVNDVITQLEDRYDDIKQSEAFSTIAVELKESPEIPGVDPCAKRPVVGNGLASGNHYKRQKTEKPPTPYYALKTFVFNFSIIEEKKALIIYVLPELGEHPYIPRSIFNIDIRNIKIVQKPFDPTYYVKGSGFRD